MIYLLLAGKAAQRYIFGRNKRNRPYGRPRTGQLCPVYKSQHNPERPICFLEQGCTSMISKKDKSYLIKNQKLPFQDWGSEMLCGNRILAYGGAGMGNPPSDVLLLLLTGKSREILQDLISIWYDGFDRRRSILYCKCDYYFSEVA